MKKMYELAKALRFRIDESGHLRASVSKSAGEFFCNLEVLMFLQHIQQGVKTKALSSELTKTLKEIKDNLPEPSECKGLAEELAQAGVLLSSETSQQPQQEDFFGDPWIQWAMLADEKRCLAYADALQKVIQTHKGTVVDVGAGAGWLVAAALKYGASQVFAIEETHAAEMLVKNLKAMGYSDKKHFKLYRGNSFDADLPDDTRVVVSELFGNDPFQEGLLPTLRDIASRLDIKSVEFIPKNVTVFLEAVDIKSASFKDRVLTLQQFSEDGAIASGLENPILSDFLRQSLKNFDLSSISFPAPLGEEDFRRLSQPKVLNSLRVDPPPYNTDTFFGKKQLSVQQSSEHCPGYFMWFRVELLPGITLSNHPAEDDWASHWSPIFLPHRRAALKENDRLDVEYALAEDESHVGLSIHQNGQKVAGR